MSLLLEECKIGMSVQYKDGLRYPGLSGLIAKLDVPVIKGRYFVFVVARDGYPYVEDIKYLNKYEKLP